MPPLARLLSWFGSCVLVGMLLAGPSRADKTLVLTGDVPADRLDHFFLPFEVPEGFREIEVRGDDLSPDNILDFGLHNPWPGREGFRGWGGGSTEPAIVNAKAASRGYLPGDIVPGTWRVVVGKALIRATPARYRVEVILRELPTLPPQTERTPYVPSPALKTGARYYAGDFHVHSRDSTDARPDLDEIATFAKSRGLDFVVITDHNTVTQDDFFVAAQGRHPDVLLIPGIEVTTYAGHMNALGATRFVEHKVDQPGASLIQSVQDIHDQGALLSINHPLLDLGDACIGCAFRHPMEKLEIDAIEVATGGLSQGGLLFSARTLKLWDDWNNQAFVMAAAIGGSDDHQAGKGTGRTQSPIGDPTTMVFADALSAEAILRGVEKGATVVKLQGPSDPMLKFSSRHYVTPSQSAAHSATPDRPEYVDGYYLPGSLLQYGERATFTASVTGTAALPAETTVSVRFVKDGEPLPAVPVTSDPFVHTYEIFGHPDKQPHLLRAEVLLDGVVHTVATPIYIDEWDATIHPTGCECALLAGRNPAASATRSFAGLAILCASYILARLRLRRKNSGDTK